MPDTEPGSRLSTKLNRLSEIARKNPTLKFTSLAHLLNKECLIESYKGLNTKAAAGIDHVSYKEVWKGFGSEYRGFGRAIKKWEV